MTQRSKKTRKERNYAAFFALLRRMPHTHKELLVSTYTDGRTDSLKEMSDGEYTLMLKSMQQELADRDRLRLARSKALHQLQLYGVDTTNWYAINQFVGQPRIAGKPFGQLSVAELADLTRKMRAIISKGGRSNEAAAYRVPLSDVGHGLQYGGEA